MYLVGHATPCEADPADSSNHEDMHGGEAETSILLAISPEVVRPNYHDADFTAEERRHLLTLGIRAYSASGVIGRPSLTSPGKGKRLLEAFRPNSRTI